MKKAFAVESKQANPYQTLGIEPGASQSDIKKKYIELVKKFHPDLNPQHGETFKSIQEAYDILNSTDKQKEYDAFGSN